MAVEMEAKPSLAHIPTPWNPGQHLAVIGMTGQGKSTVIAWLLEQRRYWIVLKSKPDEVEYPGTIVTKDPRLNQWVSKEDGSHTTKVTRKATSLASKRRERYLLEPWYSKQAMEFEKAYEIIWKMGGWTVDIDELYYHDDQLKLRSPINRLLTQGRSKGISVVCGMQRPASVTRFAVGESTHVLSFQLEGRDASIFRDATSSRAAQAVQILQRHEFVWYRRPNFLAICKLNLESGALDFRQV